MFMMSELKKDQLGVTTSSLDRLQKDALGCLEGFPSKIIDLNNIIEIYAPTCTKTNIVDDATINKFPSGAKSISSTIGEYDMTSSPDVEGIFDVGVPALVKLGKSHIDLASLTSYYSLTTAHNDRNGRIGRHGVNKRRYYRVRGGGHATSTFRRRPAALGQLVAFIASKLAVCTRNIVITPSWYIMQRIAAIFFRRREVKNVQCGPCADWSSSLSACVTSIKEDNTIVGNFVNAMRPVAVQLITDTTILKRWLQTLAATITVPCPELVNATRNTETIDCWAYELFFHLKYLQVNRARENKKIDDSGGGNGGGGSGVNYSNDDVTHLNLWNRMVQLRDNYIILYEILYSDPTIRQMLINCK